MLHAKIEKVARSYNI